MLIRKAAGFAGKFVFLRKCVVRNYSAGLPELTKVSNVLCSPLLLIKLTISNFFPNALIKRMN